MGSWQCPACTYMNLQSGAKKCHMCKTMRGGIGNSSTGTASGVPLVDLTCLSPKEDEDRSYHDIMVSNRRRKRIKGRREERSDSKMAKKICTDSTGSPNLNLNIAHPPCGPTSHPSPEEMYNKALTLLRQTFQHQALRSLQERAVRGALQNKSQIIVLATGGGKSLCYQLPALVSGHNFKSNIRADQSSVTIVVTPLISLMIDQVKNLNRRGVRTAAFISSSQTAQEKNAILNRLRCDAKVKRSKADTSSDRIVPIKLLYCTVSRTIRVSSIMLFPRSSSLTCTISA